MQLDYEYQRETLQPELTVESDTTCEAYESLANSQSTTVAVKVSKGKTSYVVKGRTLDLRNTKEREGLLLNLKPVGLVQCVAATEDCVYGTCQHGGIEYDVIRDICYRISERDPRLQPKEFNLFLKDPFQRIWVEWELKRKATATDAQILKALTNQQVDTDALRKGLSSVAAEVKLKVYRDCLGGIGANKTNLKLMDLLFI